MDRPEAILLDFYGTVVEEDDPVIASVRQTIYASATANDPADPKAVGAYWWALFSDLCATSAGQTFATQRELERRSLQGTIEYFGSNARLQTPPRTLPPSPRASRASARLKYCMSVTH
ncbi:hypothetical protein ACXC9Q_18460 [Kribbella sp. CWNU-51]